MATLDLEVTEALRDALNFINGTARLYDNEGTPLARRKAEVCREEYARLYPVYARLTGCEVAAEQVPA